ncbi:MAG: glycosyltransferase family 2 protein [Verrucomicrobia bacterium]|nr:glycosyltransferase family 2 protein [Verrucomicrobiota bacterium]
MGDSTPERLDESVFAVIPAHNEAPVLRDVIAGLLAFCRNVVVVDDGSRDQTAAVAREAGAQVVRHLINRGQGAAIRTGMDFALSRGAKVIVTFDADGQHDPADLPAIVAPLLRGECDVALGTRFQDRRSNVPGLRRLVLRGGIWFTRVVSGIKVTDTHNGFRAFSRRAAEMIEINQDQMAHASEILDEIARQRLRYCEVPVRVRYSDYSRQKGQSSWASLQIVWHFLFEKLRR